MESSEFQGMKKRKGYQIHHRLHSDTKKDCAYGICLFKFVKQHINEMHGSRSKIPSNKYRQAALRRGI
jgi:hypothetical protein